VSAKVTLLVGPARSGKTTWLAERFRAALQAGPPGAALWLAPTWRAGVEVRGRLLDGRHPGWFAPNVMTFDRFAEATVECSSVPIRPIDQAMKRQLVRRIVDRRRAQGRLEYFGPIAETSGLVDMLCDWISEMKRLEIWPDQLKRACTARGMGQKDRELLDLYEAYQQALTEHQLYDAEGRFWSARDWLSQYMEQQAGSKSKAGATEAALPRPWQDLRLVVVDGFSDFTHTQHEILELLAQGIDELLVSLPLESEEGREDLFAKPGATLERLKRGFRRAEVVEFARAESPTRPALAHLERKLFANPRHTEDAPSTEGLEIIAAAGKVNEIEQIAARIKGLLLSGRARPGEIVVVFRSLSGQADLVRELFGRLGIPAALESAEGLWQCPVLRFLVTFVRSCRNGHSRARWLKWNARSATAASRAVASSCFGRCAIGRRGSWTTRGRRAMQRLLRPVTRGRARPRKSFPGRDWRGPHWSTWPPLWRPCRAGRRRPAVWPSDWDCCGPSSKRRSNTANWPNWTARAGSS